MASKKTKPSPPRGEALVEAVIARVIAGSAGELENPDRRPMPEEQIAALAFPNGKPLPPSMRRWLRFDASWPQLFADPAAPAFRGGSLEVFGERVLGLGETMGAAGLVFLAERFPGDFYLVGDADDGFARAIYVGEADAAGEYPIAFVDGREEGSVSLDSPRFDVHLAWMGYLVQDAESAYGAAMKEQRKLNFRRRTEHSPLG